MMKPYEAEGFWAIFRQTHLRRPFLVTWEVAVWPPKIMTHHAELPSGNQIWQTGKSSISCNDFPSFSLGISNHTTGVVTADGFYTSWYHRSLAKLLNIAPVSFGAILFFFPNIESLEIP